MESFVLYMGFQASFQVFVITHKGSDVYFYEYNDANVSKATVMFIQLM